MSTTKFKVNGVDLSTVFAAYTSGTKASTTYYKVSGNDLCNIFQKYTSGSQASTTGIKVNGSDLNTIFAPITITKTWSSFGTLSGSGIICNVIYIDSTTSDIYIGGVFNSVNSVSNTFNVAKKSGSTGSWSALERGLGTFGGVGGPQDLKLIGGLLYACGDFNKKGTGLSSDADLNHFAYYQNSAWNMVYVGFVFSGTICYNIDSDSAGNVYVGGNFTRLQASGTYGTSSGDFNRIAYWDGSLYRSLPTGAGNGKNGFNNTCIAIKYNPVNGHMYFGGSFTTYFPNSATGVTCNYVCGYTAGAFYRLNTTTPGISGGTTPIINTIEVDTNGDVYVGGTFTAAGGTSAKNVAKWTRTTGTSGSWSALGVGLGNTVNVLKYYNGILYAGGTFTTLGNGTVCNYIAQYSNGVWSTIDNSLNGAVNTISFSSDGKMYVGGSFTTPYNYIAVYS